VVDGRRGIQLADVLLPDHLAGVGVDREEERVVVHAIEDVVDDDRRELHELAGVPAPDLAERRLHVDVEVLGAGQVRAVERPVDCLDLLRLLRLARDVLVLVEGDVLVRDVAGPLERVVRGHGEARERGERNGPDGNRPTHRGGGDARECVMQRTPSAPEPDLAAAVAALRLEPVAEAAAETPVYLVGGAVRDLLLGADPEEIRNLDLAVEGDAIELARAVAREEMREHERFGTATINVGGRDVDLARTRTETYERPGALPDVEPASLAEDLGRRDFSLNAMAVPLASPSELVDPLGGREDLAAGRLRILHPGSFEDDPTRALRAARYAARLGFGLEEETAAALRRADLGTVSPERVEGELARILEEEGWRRGFELLAEWGLAPDSDVELMGAVRETLARPAWRSVAPEKTAMLVAGVQRVGTYAPSAGPLRQARELVARPAGPASELAAAAREAAPVALAIARALGAEWLDRYVEEWRDVRLEIDGEELMAAGVPQGPAVGRGLAAALDARLDGLVEGREGELEVALAAARGA
jgi:tRNA nucleotidyltransferase (CCA-adding enzyme)